MKNQPKSSDSSTLFSVTIVLRPNESDDGLIYNRKESITSGIHDYIRKNAIEGVLIQSVEGKCLTLSSAIRFGTSRVRHDLQKHLRDRHVLKFFEDRPNAIQVMCTVTSAREDERHAIYETLRRMVRRLPTAASQGEAGQQRLLATSTLVLDTVPAAADPPAPLSAGDVRPGAPAAQFLGGAPPPASAAAPHVAGRAVAAGAPRADPGLRTGAPGPAGPPVASAAGASCVSGVLPLCGLDRSRFIRVAIKVDVGGSSIFENTWREAYADPYLASRVVEETSRFFGERQMDHILSTTASDPLRGVVDLACVATAPGLVEKQQTARDLRHAIVQVFDGCPRKQNAILHLEVVPSTEAEFQAARAALADRVRDDSAFHLIVEGGVAATRAVLNSQASAGSRHDGSASAGKQRRPASEPASDSRAGPAHSPPGARENEMRNTEGIGSTPSSLPSAAAASFAAVMAAGNLPGPSFSASASAASEQWAKIRASYQPPLDHRRVLDVAELSLLLLGAVVPAYLNLAAFADTVNRQVRANLGVAGLEAAVQEALLDLRRDSRHAAGPITASAPRERPVQSHSEGRRRSSSHTPGAPVAATPATPATLVALNSASSTWMNGSTTGAPVAATPATAPSSTPSTRIDASIRRRVPRSRRPSPGTPAPKPPTREALIQALVRAGQLEEPAGDAAPGQERPVCQDLHAAFDREDVARGICSDCDTRGILSCPTHSQSGFSGDDNGNPRSSTAAPDFDSFRSNCDGMECAGCCSCQCVSSGVAVRLCGHARAVDPAPAPVESQARLDGGSRAQSAETPSSTDAGAGLQASEFNELLNADVVCGGPSQQVPLEDYAYYHSSHVYNSLMQLEHGLSYCSKRYREAINVEARRLGWLRANEYCFSSERKLERNENRASDNLSRASVPVRIPVGLPRILKSSSSGAITASAIQYRRLLTAEIRGLYLQLIVRQHYTEEACVSAAQAEAKLVGNKRKRGEEDDSEPEPEGVRQRTESSKKGARRGGSNKTMEERRMMAAASAFISDVPLVMLKLLVKELNDRNMAIVSEKKLRKKILKEIKQEARLTRQDPMTVLEAAVKTAGSSGSMRQFAVLSGIMNKSIGSTLPTAEQIAKCKRELMVLAVEDLALQPTPDGYRISLIRTVEREALRLMQTINTSKNQEVRAVGQELDRPNWQDHYHVKLTFDARRVTKHCSQTEVMIVFLPKGQKGVERCQKAVHIRTVAVWSGKDSKDNVVRNLRGIVAEAAELEKNGIAFSLAADSFDKVVESVQFKEWLVARETAYTSLPSTEKPSFGEWLKTRETPEQPVPFRRVGISFWVAADMLAQCSLLGQGCAGHLYCAHCNAHKANRHLPFELVKVGQPTNFFELANSNDTKVETLWAINTCEDLGTGEQQPWNLTEEGLRGCTLPCMDPSLARVVAAPSNAQRPVSVRASAPSPPLPVQSAPVQANSKRNSKGKRKQVGVAPAPSQTMHEPDGALDAPLQVQNYPEGPCVDVIKRCCGWKRGHSAVCTCEQCVIPAGTIVRRMIQPGFSRESEFLNENWPGVPRGRFSFCALHCNMRITEAMFYNICQNALAAGDPAVARLNAGMQLIGLKSKKFQKVRMFNCDNFERLSFLGHEALLLLVKKADGGRRNIQVLLEHLWPSGDASESPEGLNFVRRSIVLWESWAEVVELMSQRDPENLRKSIDGKHGNGFARFGKVCREFVFRYQAMFHKTHCKSFYLHTLLAHAGDFMRELEKHNMCLGMMSNSGAERRHEYGRRAFRRSLCGGCWAKYDPELANKANMSAYLTLREILIWQYGSDLLSHEKARRAAARTHFETPTNHDGSSPAPPALQSRCQLTEENLASHCEMVQRLKKLVDPLLSDKEEEKELNDASDHTESATNHLAEIKNGWASLEYDRGLALESVPVTCEEDIPHSALSADGTKAYLVSNDARLTNGRCEVLSDCSGDGSDDQSSDGSDSDVGAARDAGMRFEHLPEFPDSDSDDGAWDGSIIGSDAGSESSASDCNSVEGGGGSCAANSAGARRSSRATVRTPAGPGFELLHAGHGNGPGEASYSPTVSTASEVRSTAVQQQQSDPAVGSTDCSAVGSTAVQQQALQVHPTSSGSTERPKKTGAHNVRAQQSDSAMRLVKTNVPAKRAGKQSKPKESAKKKKTPKLTMGQKIIAGMVPLFRSSV